LLSSLYALLPLLCSCALNPQPPVGLEKFVHNLSVEMDCLRYCAKTNKDYTKSAFFLKDPIHLTLSVTNQGKITASATPTDIFSITGLKANIAQTRAGTLDLTLSSLEYCENVTIDAPNRTETIVLKKAYYFLQTINNTEYIYIEGEPAEKNKEKPKKKNDGKPEEKNSRRRFYRLPMDKIKHIECVADTNATAIRPPGCNCPGEED